MSSLSINTATAESAGTVAEPSPDRRRTSPNHRRSWADRRRIVAEAVARGEAHLPILAASAVAFAGQMGFAAEVLLWGFLGQVLYAAGLETLAYSMARLASRVRRAGEKGGVALAATWGFAIFAATCNYWHHSPTWAPTPAAVAFGVLSLAGVAAFLVHDRYAVREARRMLDAPSPDVAETVEDVEPEDGRSRTERARDWLSAQRDAGRDLAAVEVREVVDASGLKPSYARQILRQARVMAVAVSA